MEVLIVSRTRMRNGVCCGGLDLQSGEFIRLHDHWGKNLTESAPFQIGEVYDLNYRKSVNARPIRRKVASFYLCNLYLTR